MAIIDFLSVLPGFCQFFEFLIGQKPKKSELKYIDLVKGILCMASIVLFTYHPEMHKHAANENLHYGFILLAVSLVADGLLGLKEKLIKAEVSTNPKFEEYKNITSWYFMLSLNAAILVIMTPLISK